RPDPQPGRRLRGRLRTHREGDPGAARADRGAAAASRRRGGRGGALLPRGPHLAGPQHRRGAGPGASHGRHPGPRTRGRGPRRRAAQRVLSGGLPRPGYPERRTAPPTHPASPTAADVPLATLMDAAVAAIGGAPRQGQQSMAAAVDLAMSGGRHLLVQAGTGTGKSLAYLVPAVRHALVSGRPVVVSTATIALQSQIVRKDLPRLVEALAPHLPRTPTFALLKGRANYLCKHKIAGGYPVDIEPGALFAEASADPARSGGERLGQQVRRLREWAEETDSGDRDSLEDAVSDRAWRQVSVTGTQCI